MDTYNNSTVTNHVTTMKVRQATNNTANNLADAKHLVFPDKNCNATITYYKNSRQPTTPPSDGDRGALLAFYRGYGNYGYAHNNNDKTLKNPRGEAESGATPHLVP